MNNQLEHNIDISNLSHILFDLDGVVIDGFHYMEQYRKVWCSQIETDIGINEKQFEKALFGGPWKEVITGKEKLEVVLSSILPSLGFKGSVDQVIEYWLTKDSNINRPMVEFMQQLSKQYPNLGISISTNQEHNRAQYLWHDCGLHEVAERIFYSAEIGTTKEDPRFFTTVRETLGSNFHEMLVIDDTPGVLKTAESLGMQTFRVQEPHQSLLKLIKAFNLEAAF